MKSLQLFLCIVPALTMNFSFNPSTPVNTGLDPALLALNLHSGLSERIGRHALEFMFHLTKTQPETENLIASPITVWTILAVTHEGASGQTANELRRAIRISTNITDTRLGFLNIAKWLRDNTTTVELANVNSIFIDTHRMLKEDFKKIASMYYDAKVFPLDFKEGEAAAETINSAVSQFTHGRITKLIEGSYLDDTQMILTSAVYFKGQWAAPFNKSSTAKMPFYDSMGKQIGEVNMMFNRWTYPFANVKELQARVLELPYGKENRLSMLILLPYANVTLESMYVNFQSVPLDRLFTELRVSQEEYADDEVDCMIPRFKIESSIDLKLPLQRMGIHDLFSQFADLSSITDAKNMYVSKINHKAEIEVTEEGTVAAAATAAEFVNRIGIMRFEANRPFVYMIIEKVTNTMVFAGVYRVPSLY